MDKPEMLTVYDYLTTLSRKPACLDHASVFRDWRLPAVFDELRHTLERAHGPRTGVRHYIRVLQLLRSHPASRIETAIRRCHHRQTLTAEIIAEKALSLMNDDTHSKDFPITPVIERRVQVPMPDLLRFDQLLTLTSPEGDKTDVRPTTDAFEAQPQDPALADHTVGVRPAVT